MILYGFEAAGLVRSVLPGACSATDFSAALQAGLTSAPLVLVQLRVRRPLTCTP